MQFVSKSDIATIISFGVAGLVGVGIWALLPDLEISDNQYVQIAQAVALCPAADSALAAINKDHVILQSEADRLNSIISEYVEQDERATEAHNIAIAKGLIKGPLQQRTCLPLPSDYAPATVVKKPK